MTFNSARLCLLIKRKLKWDTKRCAKLKSFEKHKWNKFIRAALKSSPVPCPREEGEAQSSLQVLQRESSPRALWGCHIVPPSARRGMPASQNFSWVEQSILSIYQLAKRWGQCQVPCLPGANQLALGTLRSLQSQAEGRRQHGGLAAGWTWSWHPHPAQEAV